MNIDFPDTEWNKIVSESNMSSYYKGCTTLLYKNYDINQSELIILSYNYRDESRDRKIEIIYNDGSISEIKHNLLVKGAWVYNISDNIHKIKVYENDEFIYEEINENIKNYLKFK